jgi:repressor LexA
MSAKEVRNKVYKYVVKRLEAGDPPSIREVQTAMKFKAVETARSHLEALVAEGKLVKRGSTSRAYALPAELWSAARSCRVPLLGSVQAGNLTLAVQEPEGYLQVEHMRYGEELFALRVQGESMSGAGILPDDFIIARRQSIAQEGDIVVALVDEEATVKRLRYSGKNVVLAPENPAFEPIVLSPENVTLLGKVVEVRRYYE